MSRLDARLDAPAKIVASCAPARRAAIRALLAAAAAALAAPAARASDMDQFGFGARPISMGDAFTALATDFTGAYYNPAAPAASKNLSVGAGLSYGHYALEYTSETGPNDADVERQDALSAFTIGFSTPIDQEPDSFLSRFALALGLSCSKLRVRAARGTFRSRR